MDADRAGRFLAIPQDDPPLVITGAEDVWLIRDNGQRILDAAGGAIVTNVGHGRPELIASATAALSSVDYVLPLWATENRVALVEELTEHWLPAGFTQAAFFSGGSESVDAAVRLARTYQLAKGREERWKIVGRDVSYHGSTLSGLSVGNHDRRRAGLDPMLSDHPKADWLDPESIAKVIEREDPDTIAAFIGEPISGASGAAMVPSTEYWLAVEDVCRTHDIVLIVDEVMTGFGRTGRTWGHQHFGITPDIIVGGKGLSGGYVPMGGLFTTANIVDPIAAAGLGLMYFTFSGADLGCAVSRSVLEIIRTEQLIPRAEAMGRRLRARLERVLGDHPNVADIRGLGLMQGLELCHASGEPFAPSAGFANAVVGAALERGVWLYPCGSGPVVDGILLGPPYTITDAHIDLIAITTRDAIDAAAALLEGV